MNVINICIIAGISSLTLAILSFIYCHCRANERRIQRANNIRRHVSRLSVQSPLPENITFSIDETNEPIYGFDPEIDLEFGSLCQICQEHMDGKQTIGKIHPCKHAFHKSCVYKWFVTQYNEHRYYHCPVCREDCPPSLICTKIVPLKDESNM